MRLAILIAMQPALSIGLVQGAGAAGQHWHTQEEARRSSSGSSAGRSSAKRRASSVRSASQPAANHLPLSRPVDQTRLTARLCWPVAWCLACRPKTTALEDCEVIDSSEFEIGAGYAADPGEAADAAGQRSTVLAIRHHLRPVHIFRFQDAVSLLSAN